MAAGSYWLAYLPSSNALGFVKTNVTGNCKYYSYNFGSLPSKFSTSPASCNPTTWSFYATLTASSSGIPTAVNGACGSSNGASLTSAPTANLCTAGTASTVSGSGPWSWSCAGSGGGTTATCSATRSLRAACERRVRQRERGSGKHRADREPLHRRHGVDCQRQRPVVVELRRQQWRQHRVVLGYARLHRHDRPRSTGTTGSDPTSGVLPSYNDAYANWKNAGLQSVGGIPDRTTVCATVNPLGGGQDDFTDIQNAINKCPAGDVVQLGAGAFTVHLADLPIQISTGIVLRGTGSCTGSSSPYCQTSITVSDELAAYSANTGGQCGTSTSSESSCPNGGPPIV